MEISFYGLSFAIKRTSSRREIDLDDIHEINRTYREYIEAQPIEDVIRRTEDVTVSKIGDPKQFVRAKEILQMQGVVVVPDVVDPDSCDLARKAIRSSCEYYESLNEPTHEDEKALYQGDERRLNGYHEMAGYGKSVINVRKGQDAGMVDIFNCDAMHPRDLRPFRDAFTRSEYMDLMAQRNVEAKNLNVYWNCGITSTRGFHVDSYKQQIKGFIYLSDVSQLRDGPYTYVKRSHRESGFRRVNRYLGQGVSPDTEAPVLDPMAITPILAPKGALVISDQGGVHRGWPQGKNAERMIAVMNYQ